MKTIREKTICLIAQSLEGVVECGSLLRRIELRTPKHPEHGDFSTNICLQVASRQNLDALDLARRIKAHVESHTDLFEKIEIAGEGHVNFHLNNKYFKGIFKEIETGRFEAFEARRESKRFVVAMEKLSDIVCLCDLRAFVNMYTLAGLYSLAGYEVEKYILVKDEGCDLAVSYFLSNFDRDLGPRCEGLGETDITTDSSVLEGAVVFLSRHSELSYPELAEKALMTEKVHLYDGETPVECFDVGDVMENADLERIKYSLLRIPYGKEIKLQYQENNVHSLQYVYSRTRSILHVFREESVSAALHGDFDETLLAGELEKTLVKELADYRHAVEQAVQGLDPARYVAYAERLSALFHDINDNILYRQLDQERLGVLLKLYRSLAMVFSSILDQLEVAKPERM